MVNSSLFRRIELQMLMNLTAKAFGERPQRTWTRSNDEALKAYAEYTSRRLHAGADERFLQRMNSEALKMGRLLRHVFFVRSEAKAQRLIVALYRNIGISLSWTDGQQLCFHSCYFSSHYTPAACLAASALDDGIILGITGQTSCQLHFSQRITEGCGCCKARLECKERQEVSLRQNRNVHNK